MMNKTRVFAAILAAVMLLSALCSCGVAEEETGTTAATTAGTTAATEVETEITDDLPDDLDYNDDEVVILSRYREGWTSGEIAVEKLIGEPVNDAVYERNQAVEERLGVKLVSVEEPGDSAYNVTNKASLSVKAGTHEYDIMAAACYVSVNESLNGILTDMRRSEYIDFDKP